MNIKKGNLLVADPAIIGNSVFSRSVVLLTDYNEQGVVGFVLNKPSSFFLDAFFENVPSTHRVFVGGPVEKDYLYYIHNRPDLISGSVAITENIYWGGNFVQVIDLIKNELLQPEEIKFFLGYSGWEEQQLELEIEEGSWALQKECSQNHIFSYAKTSLWKDCLKQLGDAYVIWQNTPENPQYN